MVILIISFKRCHLQLNNLNKLFFVKKNWPNDPRIGCKPFFSLVELIEINAKLKEFEEFEGTFERDAILEI